MKAGQRKPRLTEVDKVVGMNLKRLRIARGLCQQDVGKALGLSFQQVQKYERGDNRMSVATMLRLAEFLHVPLTEFVTGAHLPPPPDDIEHSRETLELIRAFGRMTEQQRGAFSAFARSMTAAV